MIWTPATSTSAALVSRVLWPDRWIPLWVAKWEQKWGSLIVLFEYPDEIRKTKQFERRYDGRTSVERVNGRLKIVWGIDDGNVVGSRRYHAHVGAVMIVHLAFATQLAEKQENEVSFGKMRV